MAAEYPTIAIESYDVTATPMSGYGCWSHAYSGTITDTGRTADGPDSCDHEGAGRIANYTGGSGTLNDGVISDSIAATHLLLVARSDDAGVPIEPVITLHLAERAYVQGIRFHGGEIPWNFLPGLLTGVTVEIDGHSYADDTIPVGSPNAIGVPSDDLLDLVNAEVSWYPTTTVVLRNFTADFFGYAYDQMALSEITVLGEPATEVRIDVKADKKSGDGDPVIQPSRGKVPVIIYGGQSFDVATILADGGSMTFGVFGSEASLAEWPIGCAKPDDTDRDGFPDLTCIFQNAAVDWSLGITTVHLNGRTTTGERFHGSDTISVRD